MSTAAPCWYIRGEGNEPAGPFTPEQILELWRAGRVAGNTICWHESMPQWLPLSQVEPFASAMRSGRVDPRSKPDLVPPRKRAPAHMTPLPQGAEGATLPGPIGKSPRPSLGLHWLTSRLSAKGSAFPTICIVAVIVAVFEVSAVAIVFLATTPGQMRETAQAPVRPSPSPSEEMTKEMMANAACGTCFAGCGTFIAVIVGLFVLNIVLLVWVASDAKARGMSGVAWLALILFFGPIGLIVYVFARPQGSVIRCLRCRNKRLQVSATCPHCGNP